MKIAVIGGGASGIMAALSAHNGENEITIFERNDRIGKKILATGNGKCNLANEDMKYEYYHSENMDQAKKILDSFTVEDTKEFFRGIGLMLKSKNGYLYPASEQASAVLDILRLQLKVKGIHVVTEAKVNHIKHLQDHSIEIGYGNEREVFDRVIISCGGKAAPKTGSDGSGFKLARQLGHTVTDTYPALVQLTCNDGFCKALAGIRAEGEVTVYSGNNEVAKEYGEIQFTDYGISGIPVFQLSRTVNKELRNTNVLKASIDFMPNTSREELVALNENRYSVYEEASVEEYFTGILNKKLMMVFIKDAGLRPTDLVKQVSKKQLEEVFMLCKNFVMHIDGSNSYEQAQVSAGGVTLEELTDSLESKYKKGIYFAGEVLDVDGRCGGYNLQWAWASGYVAGKAAGNQKGNLC